MRKRSAAAIWVLGVACLLLAARAGVAYRFYRGWNEFSMPPAAAAHRWNTRAFPVQFRLLENDLLPRGWSQRSLRPIVARGLEVWNRVPTSTFRAELAEDVVIANRIAFQGINEIGFSDDFEGREWLAGFAAGVGGPDGIYECDIALDPEGRGDDERAREILTGTVIHELGHCLGLAHTQPYPVVDWEEDLPATFRPPPVMSYAWFREAVLAEDDRVGVSLLYPTPGFTRSRGSVGGRVVLDGEPARYVYVQALRTGTLPEPGPGTFTDENGEFLLEGLRPGPTLLWMHPILVFGTDPHSGLRELAAAAEGRSAAQDQWRWVTVRAGETRIVSDIAAATGRVRKR